jgi:hypothetical protein
VALQKAAIPLNFVQGLDTKSDPKQVQLGKFLALTNTVFSITGQLTKRNGYPKITTLPTTSLTTLTTLNDNLIATGANLYTFSPETSNWIDQGSIQPIQLETQSLVRNSTSQTSPDVAIASNGLACLAYNDSSGNAYYHIIDSANGSQVVEKTQLPATAQNPRVFILNKYFIVTFIATVAATPTLQFISITIANPSNPSVPTNISADINSLNAGYDGQVYSNKLYIAWGASANTVKVTLVTSSLSVASVQSISGITADTMAVTVSSTNNRVFLAYSEATGDTGYVAAYTLGLTQVMAATQFLSSVPIRELTAITTNGVLSVYYEIENTYTYGTALTDYVETNTITLPISGTGVGTVGTASVVLRSVGLASKAFKVNGIDHMLVAYGDAHQTLPADNSNQPTYFLIDSTGQIYLKLAYSNGGGYAAANTLPSVTYLNDTYYVPYLITDFLTTVNKGTDLPAGTPSNAIYTQTGVNLAKIQINLNRQYSSEIAGSLHLTGGQLWQFDTVKPVELGFNVWPENVLVTTATTGGNITDQTYYYSATYEWTDNAGMLHRSAPSIPFKIVTTGGNVSTNTIKVPTLRLTAKDSTNPVRIVLYRWSVGQQIYYQVTSVTNPVLNDTSVDYVTITDTLADSAILGNTLLYTTGGVVENIAPPASIDSCLFDNRLWLINAEDPNTLWFSKQIIQNTPVEMSDLFTEYIAPSTGTQNSTGPSRCIAALDDKLIIFKDNALYYINGSGPDNTGSNSSYSQPTYITGVVGCANPNSIVLIPSGLMFQSNKGIWLLDRALGTKYIGADVEAYNSDEVLSAEAIPNSTQVRFILASGKTLMYDYFYDQWGDHTNIKAISACVYRNAHTYLNEFGQVLQERVNTYMDDSQPVLIGLTTSWINIAGVQGFERFYFAYLLGTYYSPFKLNVTVAYDYNPSATQSIIVTPEGNPAAAWGGENQWGGGAPWGGSEGNVFEARLFPQQQKCQSFRLSIQEIYDPSYNQAAGQGLSLSGLNIIIGTKRGFRTQTAGKSFG